MSSLLYTCIFQSCSMHVYIQRLLLLLAQLILSILLCLSLYHLHERMQFMCKNCFITIVVAIKALFMFMDWVPLSVEGRLNLNNTSNVGILVDCHCDGLIVPLINCNGTRIVHNQDSTYTRSTGTEQYQQKSDNQIFCLALDNTTPRPSSCTTMAFAQFTLQYHYPHQQTYDSDAQPLASKL